MKPEESAMHRLSTSSTLALLSAAVTILLSGCSRTVTWEEEVPLNTGDTIWVKRAVVYAYQGAGGNPLDIGLRPTHVETLSFKWGGRQYVYQGDAAIMLLAISPSGLPVLVAPAADRSWDWEHEYYCTTPYYVQFVPDSNGTRWTWPPRIETWLYGLPHNLMRQRRNAGEMKDRYSASDRTAEDAVMTMQSPSRAVVDATHVGRDCKRKRDA